MSSLLGIATNMFMGSIPGMVLNLLMLIGSVGVVFWVKHMWKKFKQEQAQEQSTKEKEKVQSELPEINAQINKPVQDPEREKVIDDFFGDGK